MKTNYLTYLKNNKNFFRCYQEINKLIVKLCKMIKCIDQLFLKYKENCD